MASCIIASGVCTCAHSKTNIYRQVHRAIKMEDKITCMPVLLLGNKAKSDTKHATRNLKLLVKKYTKGHHLPILSQNKAKEIMGKHLVQGLTLS